MATGTAGSSARDLKMPVVQTLAYQLAYNTTGAASGVAIGTIPANAIILNWFVNVSTSFNAGTTNPIGIGTTATGVEIMATSSITNYNTSSNTTGAYSGRPATSTGWAKFSADQVIYTSYIPTGGAATTGAAQIVITYITTDDNNA